MFLKIKIIFLINKTLNLKIIAQMETLRVLFRKIEGKLNNIFEFSIIDKILRL